MNGLRCILLIFSMSFLASCASNKDTIASLRGVQIEIKEVEIDGGVEKAMQGYQKFLDNTPETAMTPEALRRLADLKIQKEYDVMDSAPDGESNEEQSALKVSPQKITAGQSEHEKNKDSGLAMANGETVSDFEKRTTEAQKVKSPAGKLDAPLPEGEAELLETAGLKDAIKLYKRLLAEYPDYERNDQVLYQLSRAYEEMAQVEEAMEVLDQMVSTYPNSRHMDEAQFRRAENFFMHKKYLDAEEAYQSVLDIGKGSHFYELAIYKQGWAFFKQDLYEEALHRFMGLLDHKVTLGYDFDQTEDKMEKKRIEDNYRVISLSFSYLGGAEQVHDYFNKYGRRTFEDGIYLSLAEYYVIKRRYSDGARTYNTFVKYNPYHRKAPNFHMRVIDIYKQGGFPKLIIEGKKEFSTRYGLGAEYWNYFSVSDKPDVLAYVKSNLIDLGNHYHALYQSKRFRKFKAQNYDEAVHWYKEFLRSFPADEKSPITNYQLADLYLESKNFGDAAMAYERTAYEYPDNEKSAQAGYAAVYAYKEWLKQASQAQRGLIKREIVRSSLKFGDIFPTHEKASLVLISAANDLYQMKDYEVAIKTGRQIVNNYPDIDVKTRQSAFMLIGHASYDLSKFNDAEKAYHETLKIMPPTDPLHGKIVENLAVSVYKQGEQARLLEDHMAAANHFLRVAELAPTSKVRPVAEYDAAAALIMLEEWDRAVLVLEGFRKNFPNHKLQSEATKKIAVVYKEAGKYELAALEFERIEKESKNEALRRESLLLAAELFEKAGKLDKVFKIYKRYVKYFPKPLEFALETRMKIAKVYKSKNDDVNYKKELKYIIKADTKAGRERTDRTRYLAANASLVFVEPLFDHFKQVKLNKPFKRNLNIKKKRMKKAIKGFTELLDYQVGDVTAASTYYMAEIYYHFSIAMMESERPTNLNPVELGQYELVLEEQAYPFEEKAIDVHEKNIELLSMGIYNPWIDKSIGKLGSLMPARYGKQEESIGYLESMKPFVFVQRQNVAKTDVAVSLEDS